MSRGTIFWILMLLVLLFGVLGYWDSYRDRYFAVGMDLVEFILLGLLGWKVFGPAVKD